MSDAGGPENPAPEETSTPPDERPTEDLASTPADEAQAEPEPAPEPDPLRDPIVERITAALGDDVLDTVVAKGDLTVRVSNAAWKRTVAWCKQQGFTYFCFLSGIDWLPSAEAASRYENIYAADAEPAADQAIPEVTTGVAGGDTRFQVLCRLYDVERKVGITLKTDLDDADPSVESVTSVFLGADWHERETWEMFGFDFPGHPGLRHLYLPAQFEGFPLRKDFPLLARAVKPWPGLVDKEPVPGEDEEEEAAAK